MIMKRNDTRGHVFLKRNKNSGTPEVFIRRINSRFEKLNVQINQRASEEKKRSLTLNDAMGGACSLWALIASDRMVNGVS